LDGSTNGRTDNRCHIAAAAAASRGEIAKVEFHKMQEIPVFLAGPKIKDLIIVFLYVCV
jgi:hypothetical protein